MTSHLVDSRLPPAVLEELRTCYFRIQNLAASEKLWQLLTSTQRELLGDDLFAACQQGWVVGMWMRLYDVGVERAIIDAGKTLNFLDEGTRAWLLQEIGEFSADPDHGEAIPKICW